MLQSREGPTQHDAGYVRRAKAKTKELGRLRRRRPRKATDRNRKWEQIRKGPLRNVSLIHLPTGSRRVLPSIEHPTYRTETFHAVFVFANQVVLQTPRLCPRVSCRSGLFHSCPLYSLYTGMTHNTQPRRREGPGDDVVRWPPPRLVCSVMSAGPSSTHTTPRDCSLTHSPNSS